MKYALRQPVFGLLVFCVLAVSLSLASRNARAAPVCALGACIDAKPSGSAGRPSGGASAPAPSGPSAEEIRQQRERQRLKGKAWSTDEALDYFDRKDWDNAIRSFEDALDRDPDDPDLNAWLQRAKAEKAKAQRPAVAATPPRPEPAKTGADLLLAKVPELQNSPEAERIRKGYQALLNRDWPVALAWWRQALERDPSNAALRRSVDLAQWMVERQKEIKPGPVMLYGAANAAAKGGDFDRALQLLQQLKTANPAMTAPAERMIEETQRRRASLQVPAAQDIELLFPSPYADAITALTRGDFSGGLTVLNQVKRDHPAMAATTDRMIANVHMMSPLQLPREEDTLLFFPERTYAGPMSASGLELMADGYSRKAREIFDRIKLSMSRTPR